MILFVLSSLYSAKLVDYRNVIVNFTRKPPPPPKKSLLLPHPDSSIVLTEQIVIMNMEMDD